MENKIYTAMVAIMRDVDAIKKSKKNQQQGFMFRGIDDMMNSLHDLFAKHGVFIIPEVKGFEVKEKPTKNGGVNYVTHTTITFKFVAEDGSFVEITNVGEAMDSGDKGMNKTMSIALKYALMQAFLIPTEDIADTDAETPEESEDTGLLIAIDEAERATSRQELEAVWRTYSKWYGTNQDFMTAFQRMAIKYPKQ